MIRGRLLTELLARGADATRSRRFRPLHASARWLCLNAALPAARSLFRRGPGLARTDLIARHSVLQPEDYSFLESDVDLTLVFDGAVEPAAAAAALEVHARLRAVLPFFGELEIYESRELRLKERLADGAEALLRTVWLLRKWRWQHDRLAAAPSRYHRAKAERSIRKIQERLGLDGADLLPKAREGRMIGRLIDELTRSLHRPGNAPAASARRGFLEWEVRSGEPTGTEAADFVVYCPAGAGLALLATLPDGARICGPEARASVDELRKSPAIREKLLAVTAAEWTLLRSVARTEPGSRDEERVRWTRELEEILLQPPLSPLLPEFPELAAGRALG